ncbi:MAG: hypothetical protein KVP17_000761 [Porospora cf. gigantea B]|uniref:uncharacterized protein n=1 Tax=Porospora cf. gigantea B TaxID=2853592 RepID=UPI003571E4CD|nr:MAG: hypothetical protein KVP17_000761 [Porospora cf. gigantea B]
MTAALWSEAQGYFLVVENARGSELLCQTSSWAGDRDVGRFVGSEAPVRTSMVPAEIDALYKQVREGNWKAAAPLADNIAPSCNG